MRTAFLDREQAIAELVQATNQLLRQDERVIAVGLFGSLARGDALPSSDADLLIALDSHPQRRWFDRIPEYTAAFGQASLPPETFPYTREELARLASQSGFLRTILKELIHLGGDAEFWQHLRDLVAQESG